MISLAVFRKKYTDIAGDHVTKTSDGGTGTLVTLYAGAVAATHTPEPVVFANVHVGGTATQALTVSNTATPAGYAENLDAGLSGAITGFTTAGTIAGLAAGASNASALTITENTSAAGTLTGTATLGLVSDGTGIDSAGTTALASQTVHLQGAVYALAAPILSGGTVNLGSIRTGGTFTPGTLILADGTLASAYRESLVYAATGAVVTNGSGTIASGGSAAIGFSLSTATAGNFAGTQASIALTSTGAGTSALANTALTADPVTINAKVYAPAIATLGTTSLNFGNVHVGDVANQSVGITNAATGALTDLLTGGTVGNTGIVNSEVFNLGTGLASGASGTVQIGISAAAAGSITGTAVLGFTSHDGDLADIAVNGGTVAVSAGAYAYAAPILSATTLNLGSARVGGHPGGRHHRGLGRHRRQRRAGVPGLRGQAYVLNFGSVAQNSTALTANLGVLNAAGGPADLLSGSFTVGGTTSFVNSGLTAFSGLGAGAKETSQAVTFNTGTGGVFSETITLAATGSNASNYSGALAAEILDCHRNGRGFHRPDLYAGGGAADDHRHHRQRYDLCRGRYPELARTRSTATRASIRWC